ncbi:BPSL0067 family protein [Massilia psychrophila]|uniref:BPSL0067 family protein n=1 Tax=Massilia psychrophila TaxID=1603353 RepID=UPI00351CF50A
MGDSECVALIRTYTPAPATFFWQRGAIVMGERSLASGTAIATFVNDRWPSQPRGASNAQRRLARKQFNSSRRAVDGRRINRRHCG